MKNTFFLFILFMLFISTNLFAQDNDIKEEDMIAYKSDIKRKSNETTLQFARRCIPTKATFKHKVLELSFRNMKVGRDILVCYADTTLIDEIPTVIIQLLSPWIFNGKLVYDPVFVAALDNGVEGMAKVDAVFLANADKDIAKELFIIYSHNLRIYDKNSDSWYIENKSEVRIFDTTAEPCNQNVCLDELEKLEQKFPASVKSYTAQIIKNKLKTLGYK